MTNSSASFLHVNGTAYLSGKLVVTLVNGFIADEMTTVELATFTNNEAEFSTVELNTVGWTNPTSCQYSVATENSTISLSFSTCQGLTSTSGDASTSTTDTSSSGGAKQFFEQSAINEDITVWMVFAAVGGLIILVAIIVASVFCIRSHRNKKKFQTVDDAHW